MNGRVMKVLVGLGNPGQKYEANRHNIGFMAIDAIADRYGAGPWRRRFQGHAAEVDIDRARYLLLKPATYMNESGRAVGEAIRFYKVSPADVIVFHDEIDLEPGKLRVKFGGGNAGHNGLKSISAHIGNDYQRVRLGVGHPGHRDAVAHYLLRDFSRADRYWLARLLDATAKSAGALVTGQDAKFMNDVARTIRPAAAPSDKPAKTSASVPSAEQQARKLAPWPAPRPADKKPEKAREREKELAPAVAEAAPPSEHETSLGAKLKAWFKRG